MKRFAGPTLVVAALVTLSPLAARATSAPTTWHTWTGTPTNVYRDATLDHGEFIYSNGIDQAKGANADTLHRRDYYAAAGESAPTYTAPNDLYNALTYDFFGAHRSTHNGDYQLPQDHAVWPDFTADLAELRLAVDGSDLFVRMRFTSFPRPDAQIATLTFAPASSPGAATPWPHNAGVRSPWSTALTLWGTGAQLDTATTSTALTTAGGAFRTGDHTFEARVPLASLPPGPWTMTGGSGLDDPATPGQYWTIPSGSATTTSPGRGGPLAAGVNVWDLLFSRDATWTFDELRQADDLASGDVSSDAQAVDPAQLAARATQPAPLRTGDLSRFFTKRHRLGGRHQPHPGAGQLPAADPPPHGAGRPRAARGLRYHLQLPRQAAAVLHARAGELPVPHRRDAADRLPPRLHRPAR